VGWTGHRGYSLPHEYAKENRIARVVNLIKSTPRKEKKEGGKREKEPRVDFV